MSPRVFAAVDLGASGGRVMAGAVEEDRITVHPVHRFANGAAEREGHLRWDLSNLYREVLSGLAKVREAESIGIDSWGVDYGLVDADGRLLSEPVAYRDDRTAAVIDHVHARVAPEELYAVTGVQFLPFNTLYQLAADQEAGHLDRASHAVLIADLIAFWLTGALRSEVTNASTTGLLDVQGRDWATPLLARLGLGADLLPPIEGPGELRGRSAAGTPVVTVGSHDTASAVVAVPAATDRFAYIACGTWSLVGVEIDRPVLTDDARAANFSNEAGVDGRIRFLRNVGGLWLLQECLRRWGRSDLEELVTAAAGLPAGGPRFDPKEPAFIGPGDMPSRIGEAAGLSSSDHPRIVRCVLDSLAHAYGRAVHQAAALSGVTVEVIHVIGGGSQNQLLCQLTADAAGLPVVAGPVEATALGNAAVQARVARSMPGSLEGVRRRIAASSPLRRFEPS